MLQGMVLGVADDVLTPLMSLCMTVDRRAGYYVWNVFTPIFLMVCGGLWGGAGECLVSDLLGPERPCNDYMRAVRLLQ